MYEDQFPDVVMETYRRAGNYTNPRIVDMLLGFLNGGRALMNMTLDLLGREKEGNKTMHTLTSTITAFCSLLQLIDMLIALRRRQIMLLPPKHQLKPQWQAADRVELSNV